MVGLLQTTIPKLLFVFWERGLAVVARRFFALLGFLVGGCAGGIIPSDLDSGIQGVVLAGPTCPVEMPDDPACDDQPYAATILVKTANGRFVVTRFTAGEDGRFRVPLFPGTYLLDPLSGPGGLPVSSPQTVVVESGAFTEVNVSYDTGIR